VGPCGDRAGLDRAASRDDLGGAPRGDSSWISAGRRWGSGGEVGGCRKRELLHQLDTGRWDIDKERGLLKPNGDGSGLGEPWAAVEYEQRRAYLDDGDRSENHGNQPWSETRAHVVESRGK
jgi:hypothetical protein